MKTQPPKQIDPKEIYLQAYRFHWADTNLRDTNFLRPEHTGLAAAPCMVLSSLASELYLKCLICLHTGAVPTDIHNLRKLFRKLPGTMQKAIEREWDSYIQLPKTQDALNNLDAQYNRHFPRDLAWALDEGAQAFVKIRYLYEGVSINFMLTDLPKVIRPVILQLKPEWEAEIPPPAKMKGR